MTKLPLIVIITGCLVSGCLIAEDPIDIPVEEPRIVYEAISDSTPEPITYIPKPV